ncbi:MAG: RidA family protein, partial [Rhodoblastus sp.]
MSAEQKIHSLGLQLPPPAQPAGNYVPYKRTGNLLLLSGVGPHRADGTFMTGVVGGDLSVEEGYNAARQCGLVLLANM